jgi:hypothetical protein
MPIRQPQTTIASGVRQVGGGGKWPIALGTPTAKLAAALLRCDSRQAALTI